MRRTRKQSYEPQREYQYGNLNAAKKYPSVRGGVSSSGKQILLNKSMEFFEKGPNLVIN